MTTLLQDKPRALSPEISKTLKNTFITLAGMMLITMLAAAFNFELKLSTFQMVIMFVAVIGLLFAIKAYRNSIIGLGLLAVFSALMGAFVGPLLNFYLSLPSGASIVATAAGLTAFVCVACAVTVHVTGKSFSNLRTFLFVSTLLLIVGYLVSLFAMIPALALGLTLIGVLLFTGWLLVDLGAVMTGEETSYISAAADIYLSLLNLFMHLLSLIGFISSD